MKRRMSCLKLSGQDQKLDSKNEMANEKLQREPLRSRKIKRKGGKA
jgi:hypothetical protein